MNDAMNPVQPSPAAAQAGHSPRSAAPIPVCQERHHPTVFENEYVRILDVQLRPGGMTDAHFHDVASVIVYLTQSTVRSQKCGESTHVDRATTPGVSRFAAYNREPLAHVVSNPGSTHFRVFDIELVRSRPSGGFESVARPAGADFQWEEALVRSSSLRLEANDRIAIPANPCAHLLVGIRGTMNLACDASGVIAQRTLRPGGFEFLPVDSGFALINHDHEPAEAVLLELR